MSQQQEPQQQDYSRLQVTISDQVAHLVLNVPDEYNRMPPAFWSEFPAALRSLDARGDVRALVISSTGKHFTAGMDISVFTGRKDTAEDRGRAGEAKRRDLARLQDVITLIERVRFPVIAAIQGGCVGGGVDLAAACDIRYCTRDAFFCIQEINIGLAADIGTLQRLPKLIPDGLMRELAYTGRRLPADEALRSGLVNEVYEDVAAMHAGVFDIAREIARKSPLAIHSSKELMNYARDHDVADALRYQQVWMGAVTQAGEMAAHFGARADGRDATYADLAPIPANEGGTAAADGAT
ncbi:MAG TPA: enoyl-CoA hydratase-related protein [Pseudomonadales bacterium]|nr:enoyl-CoA hydratase-related protein [Pseudomonadales bacterium]